MKKFLPVLKMWIAYKLGIRKLPNFPIIKGVGDSLNVSFPEFEKELVEGFGFKIIKFRTDWGLISFLYDEWQEIKRKSFKKLTLMRKEIV